MSSAHASDLVFQTALRELQGNYHQTAGHLRLPALHPDTSVPALLFWAKDHLLGEALLLAGLRDFFQGTKELIANKARLYKKR